MILYIHIPFCTSRCGYCVFNSYSGLDDLKDQYVEALCQDLRQNGWQNNKSLSSIFFGGGTPNTLDMNAYEKIFQTIRECYKLESDIEITLEANPNLITPEWCRALKSFGANRLSFGVQSFFEDKLKFLEREHSRQDIDTAIEFARSSGFENISIDLIYDTPLDNASRIKEEVMAANNLGIQHLSAYSLSIEKNSRLEKRGEIEKIESDFLILLEMLSQFDFSQYEVSNFFHKGSGLKCRHNLSYWKGEDYIGCGAGAVGKISLDHFKESDTGLLAKRFYTHQNIKNYILDPHYRKIEPLNHQDILLESLFLGLRSEIGVKIDSLDDRMQRRAEILLREKKLMIQDNRLFSCDYFLADELALWLM